MNVWQALGSLRYRGSHMREPRIRERPAVGKPGGGGGGRKKEENYRKRDQESQSLPDG